MDSTHTYTYTYDNNFQNLQQIPAPPVSSQDYLAQPLVWNNQTQQMQVEEEVDFLIEAKALDTTPGNFRFANQKMMLTYKYHLPKEQYYALFNQHVHTTKKMYIAHENGVGDKITPYEHTHIVIDLGKKFQSTLARVFDFYGIHPHISIIKDVLAWKKACKYICKEDKTVVLAPDDQFSYNVISGIWGKKSLAEALESCTNMHDIIPTMAAYDRKPIVWKRPIKHAIEDVDSMFPWQKKIHETVLEANKGNIDDRTIIWIADKVGSNGKNQLMSWCCDQYPENCTWLEPKGSANDIMNLMIGKIRSTGWVGETVFVNLPKSFTNSSEMNQTYKVIENLKDGLLSTTKYKGDDMRTPTFHVIVLSNIDPNIDALIANRWMIYEIDDKKELQRIELHKLGNHRWKMPVGNTHNPSDVEQTVTRYENEI